MKELLHFKFSAFKENNEDENTPESLYLVTALLIQHEILTLQDVYPWVRSLFFINLILILCVLGVKVIWIVFFVNLENNKGKKT